jgi:hypothetical protein
MKMDCAKGCIKMIDGSEQPHSDRWRDFAMTSAADIPHVVIGGIVVTPICRML